MAEPVEAFEGCWTSKLGFEYDGCLKAVDDAALARDAEFLGEIGVYVGDWSHSGNYSRRPAWAWAWAGLGSSGDCAGHMCGIAETDASPLA